VGAEHDGPRLELLPEPHGRGRQRHLILADELLRTRAYLRRKRRFVARGEQPAEYGLAVAGPERTLDDELVEVLDDVLEVRGLAAPPGPHGREHQLLAEQLAAEAREKGDHRRRLHDAGAERVCDRGIAGARRLDEPGDAEQGIAAQLERIAEAVVQ